jgi:hypothetical protein
LEYVVNSTLTDDYGQKQRAPYAAEGRMAATEHSHRAGGETAVNWSVRSTKVHLPIARTGREAGS